MTDAQPAAVTPAGTDSQDTEPARSSGRTPQARRWRPSGAALLGVVLGLIVTAALSLTALSVYNHNERRLLKLRVHEVDLVLAATAPTIQTPLASAAELADATGGNAAKFSSFMVPFVGPGREFTSVSLWKLGGAKRPVASVGVAPANAANRVATLALRPGSLNVMGELSSPRPSLGFEYNGSSKGYAVYSEDPLPSSRRSSLQGNSAFADLNYAVYLGRAQRPSDLLLTSVKELPFRGLHESDTVPFGSGTFTLVVAPVGSLGGQFFKDLPWIILGVGVLISLAAATMTERLAFGRQRALRLAGELDRVAAENRRMYIEQRDVSMTLQHALLPDTLPEVPGLRVATRYVPAPSGGDVGGDWYDVIAVDSNTVLLVIGDVSGHGLEAATTMALVRHAVLAYVAQDPAPATVLGKLSEFVRGRTHDYFATVLCVLVEVQAHRITLASAGHLPPLLLDGHDARFVSLSADPPIGFPTVAEYHQTSVSVPPGATLVAFTDGLVERRGEVLDVGLERLREIARSGQRAGEDILGRLARDLTSDDHHDDTAMVSIRWQS
jgi:serine phosphatase RsbU (regulator of sigma subunit)